MFNLIRMIMLIILVFVITACSSAGGATVTPVSSPTPFPTFEFVAPTNPPVFSTTVISNTTVEATPDAQLVERGRGRYEALQCAVCHGEGGEGTSDGVALIGLELTESDFISFMRSGGSIGADHQYSTDRLSERGAQNLYLYLLTLADSED